MTRTITSWALLLLAASAGAQIAVVGDLTREQRGAVGESYTGAIMLLNSGGEPSEVRIYQRDYTYSPEDAAVFGEPGEHPRSNALWITFAPARITLEGGQKGEVTYTVEIPDDSLLRGTYWSLILIEQVPTATEAQEKKPDEFQLTIRQVYRYAVQIVTDIGVGVFQLKFRSPRLLRSPKGRTLEVDLENTGEHVLTPSIYADVYDASGAYAGRIEGGEHRLYPTTSVRISFSVTHLSAATYKALVVADGGEDNIFGARYTLQIKE